MNVVARLLDAQCVQALALTGDEAVLDVGCGDGELTRRIGERARRVLGVDRDAAAIERARTANRAMPHVEFRTGEALALDVADFAPAGFDVVHARFLLESQRDPAATAQSIVATARPGGRIVLADDDHEALALWPPAPRTLALWHAYLRAFDAGGNDSIVGRKLVALLADAGAEPVRATSWSFGACAGEATFAAAVARLESILATWRARILAAGLASLADYAAAERELAAWRARSDAAIWYVLRHAEGRRVPE